MTGVLRGVGAWVLAVGCMAAVAGAPAALAAKPKARESRPATAKRAPPPPPATLAPAIDTVLKHGCLQAQGHFLRTQLVDMEAAIEDFVKTAATPEPLSGETCLNFAAALAPEGHGSSVALWRGDADLDRPPISLLFRSAADRALVANHLYPPFALERRRELTLPARDAAEPGGDEWATVPESVRWQVELMVRRMHAAFDIGPSHRLRLVLETAADGGTERISALELTDAETGTLVETVLWLDRADGPGAFFSTSGTDYERVFWSSPVKQARASRGVGQGSVTVKRPVSAKGGGKKGAAPAARTVRSRGHHIGIDFVAPKGTPVHAVADAQVSFVGRKGGYGNIVILDHGAAHQTYYAHLSAFTAGLKPGTKVSRGDVVGLVGSTGFSTGPHLHYEVRKDGNYIDPILAQSRLEFWSLYPQDHAHLLAHLLVLDLARRAEAAPMMSIRTPPVVPTAGAPATD